MTYNIHPIIVHFPIALLFLYSIIKILPFEKWLPKFAWRDAGLVILSVGFLGALVALSTGEIAEDMFRANHKLVETHAFFASFSTWIYGALLLGSIAHFFNRFNFIENSFWLKLRPFSIPVEKILDHKFLSKVLALVGFVAISLTGMLGGVIVYGTTADPLAAIVLKILGISI